MAWFVYLARCADDTLYCGITNDLAARVIAHNAGKGARYTRTRIPIEIVVAHRCASKGRALRLEYRIKQLTRADKQALVANPALLSRISGTASRSPRSDRGSTRRARRDRRGRAPSAR